MYDDDKCVKCVTIAKSFLGKKFAEAVKLFSESKTFRALWQEAEKNYDLRQQGTLDFSTNMFTQALNRSGFTLEHFFWFLRLKQFITLVGAAPKRV